MDEKADLAEQGLSSDMIEKTRQSALKSTGHSVHIFSKKRLLASLPLQKVQEENKKHDSAQIFLSTSGTTAEEYIEQNEESEDMAGPTHPLTLTSTVAVAEVQPAIKEFSRAPALLIPWQRSRIQQQRYIRHKWQEKRQQQTLKMRVEHTLLIIFCITIIICISAGLGTSFSFYQSQLPRVQNLANMQVDQSTHIYDRNNQLLYTLYNPNEGRRTPISYAQIPGVMQDAQIAAEDKTFWSNSGVDSVATVRSALIDIVAQQPETGASTLTQQVIKNLSGNRDPNGNRKLNEAALAIGLTEEYPKWKILEMYFNIAGYGALEVGVEAAVQDYFGLQPVCDSHFACTPAVAFLDRDLSKCSRPGDELSCQSNPLLALARASLLAGLPQNPVNFDPTIAPGNLARLLARQDYVLDQMFKDHMSINLGLGDNVHNVLAITEDTVRQVKALSQKIQFVGFQNIIKAPHFVWWIINQLANALGNYQDIDKNTGLSIPGLHLLLTGGFNIRTTLDLPLEEYVEQATTRHLSQPELQKLTGETLILSKDRNINDAATVVMDAHTGEILAMDGSASWTNASPLVGGELNAALTPRQPASTFKPIVLAAAFQMGWYPGIVLPDSPTYFPIGTPQSEVVAPYNTYFPTDYGGSYSYDSSANIDFALSNSLNIPAIKSYMYAGPQNVYDMARRLGITTIQPKQVNPTIALGTADVSLLQMVGAYQVFADQGTREQPQSMLDISDNYGHLLYHYDPALHKGTQVLSPQISYLLTSALSDEPARSYEFHNDHDLSMWDWTLADGTHPDVAAKTGTSDDFKDNWTIGYTPDLVVGVWAGNANGLGATDSIGMTGAAPIWHSVIEYASGHCNQANDQVPCPPSDLHYIDRQFVVPSGLTRQDVNTYNGLAGSGYSSWMIDGEQPQI